MKKLLTNVFRRARIIFAGAVKRKEKETAADSGKP